MQIADYHYKAGDFEAASYYYDQLIDDAPQERSAPRQAHMASIDAKLKAYIGPEYDWHRPGRGPQARTPDHDDVPRTAGQLFR